MRRNSTLLIFSTCSLLAGCSTTVNFVSDIEGATVTTVAGQSYGVTPTSVDFDKDALAESREGDGCSRILGVVYTWPSGATVTSPNPIVLCGERSSYTVKMDRPREAPGVEIDMKNAMERMKAREIELRQELERERLYNDHFWFMGPGFFRGPLPPPPR